MKIEIDLPDIDNLSKEDATNVAGAISSGLDELDGVYPLRRFAVFVPSTNKTVIVQATPDYEFKLAEEQS